MITRNFLITLFVLLAGLTTGYFAASGTRDFSKIKALEPEPQPMQWMVEWNILGASSAVLSNTYYTTRNQSQHEIDEGLEAVKGAIDMKDHILDYYWQFFMNYYRWIDTGDPKAKVSFKLAMGQFKSVLSYHKEKYKDGPNTSGMDFTEAETGIAVAENTASSVRWARVIIVVIIFLLVMGIPGFVRDRAHRRFAGSLYFDVNFRPYTITSLSAYHGTRRLAILMVVLYVLGLAVFSSFTSLLFPLSLGVSGLLYVFGLALLFNSGRDLFKIVVSLMAPKMIIMVALLFMVAIRGPIYFWYNIWVSEMFKLIFLSVFVMLIFRKFQIYVVMGRKWSRRNAAGSVASVCFVLGFQLLLVGLALHFFGIEESLAAFNDDLLVLPGGLSRFGGITTHLGIPAGLPVWTICFSLGLTAISLPVFLLNRQVRKD